MSRSPSTGPAIGLPVSNQPVQQTVYDTVDQRQLLGARGQQGELINKQGLRLATYLWPAENAKAVLIFVHGEAACMVAANAGGSCVRHVLVRQPTANAAVVTAGHGAHLPFDLLRSTVRRWAGSLSGVLAARGAAVCWVGRVAHAAATAATVDGVAATPAQGPGQAPQYTGSWAERFNAAGISVCGVDNQGCGRSEGARGLRFYVESVGRGRVAAGVACGLRCRPRLATCPRPPPLCSFS